MREIVWASVHACGDFFVRRGSGQMPGDVTSSWSSGRAETRFARQYYPLVTRVAINRPALSAGRKSGHTLQSTGAGPRSLYELVTIAHDCRIARTFLRGRATIIRNIWWIHVAPGRLRARGAVRLCRWTCDRLPQKRDVELIAVMTRCSRWGNSTRNRAGIVELRSSAG